MTYRLLLSQFRVMVLRLSASTPTKTRELKRKGFLVEWK